MYRSKFTLGLVVALCVGAATTGTTALIQYETAPGPAASPPVKLPHDSVVTPLCDRASLVMFVHPQCPCTSASLAELSKLMTRRGDRLNAYVLVYEPEQKPEDWKRADIEAAARAIPGVTVMKDPGGIEAKRFQCATSGQTLLYDGAGRLAFCGGITGARGQMGDNCGAATLISGIDSLDEAARRTGMTSEDSIKTSKVFGCLIHQRKSFIEKDGNVCLN